MSYIKDFGIKNFRIFANLTAFEFAPITILTGTNNSGKSSLINAIIILSKYASRIMGHSGILAPLFEKETQNPFGKACNLVNKRKINDSENDSKIEFYFGTNIENIIVDLIFNFSENADGIFKNKIEFESITIIDKIHNEHIATLTNPDLGNYCFSKKSYWENTYIDISKIPLSDLEDIKSKVNDSFINHLIQFSDKHEKPKWICIKKGKHFNMLMQIKIFKKELFNNIIFNTEFGLKEIESFVNDHFFNQLPPRNIQYNDDGRFYSILDSLPPDFYIFFDNAKRELIQKIGKKKLNKNSINEVCIESENSLLIVLLYFEIIEVENYTDFYNSFFKEITENLRNEIKVVINSVADIESISNSLLFGKRILYGESEYHELIIDFKNHHLILDYFENCKEFLKRQLVAFKIGNEVQIISGEEGVTTSIKIKKENEEFYLADLGFGASKVLPIILKICTLACKNFHASTNECDSSTLLIEEPESNLHPELQSKLADMFHEAKNLFNMQFIIETHSEYLIRKLQYLTASENNDLKSDDSIIYYFYHPDEIVLGEQQVKKINILANGSLTDNFGTGFFDEADKIAMELFLLNQSQKN
ncbi:MAG: DUF3696 domain-containing protein [Sediminibacterium sp.]|nr:DUF3696 domain-containing protein [Sediminibacterium sp.]